MNGHDIMLVLGCVLNHICTTYGNVRLGEYQWHELHHD